MPLNTSFIYSIHVQFKCYYTNKLAFSIELTLKKTIHILFILISMYYTALKVFLFHWVRGSIQSISIFYLHFACHYTTLSQMVRKLDSRPCANHPCNKNSTCQPIFNQNNSYICGCKSGFYEETCSKYQIACNSYCSPYSFCEPEDHSMITNTNNPFCICPLGHFGPRCFLKFEQCNNSPCLNNGNCVNTYEAYSGDSFVCICSKFFYGDRCQHTKMAIQVRLNTSAILDLPSTSTIQFYDIDPNTLQLILRHQQVTQGFPSYIYYAHGLISAPTLGVLKAHYDSNQPKYFIIYIQPNISSINTSSPLEHCPLATLLLSKSKYHIIWAVWSICLLCSDNFPNVPDVSRMENVLKVIHIMTTISFVSVHDAIKVVCVNSICKHLAFLLTHFLLTVREKWW